MRSMDERLVVLRMLRFGSDAIPGVHTLRAFRWRDLVRGSKSILQQRRDVSLHRIELVQLQTWISDREQVACPGLFVYENTMSIPDQLFFHLEHALPLEHHRQNESCRPVLRIVGLDHFAQE